jgi:ABC-type branched-subunit amino acid transport system ATPase component/ABC-type branched-subunit amino acid transport system permease subunit
MSDTTVVASETTPAGEPSPMPTRTSLLPRPPAMRGSPYLWLGLVLLVLGLTRQFGSFGLGDADLINRWLFYTVLVVGFYFIFGVSGQFAFSQAAFAAVGGYTSAWATRTEVWGTDTFWVGVITGVVVTCVIAVVFAYLMRRAGEFYLAIATLGLSEILLEILRKWVDFSGAAGDTTGGIKPIDYWWGHEINQLNGYAIFWVWFIALGLVMLLAIWLERSPVQRETIAMRDQPQVAASLGVPTLKHRIMIFVLGSAVASVAGSLFVHTKGFANPDDFNINLGIAVFVVLILGGLDSKWGALIGAAFYVFVPQWLQGGIFGISGLDFTFKAFGQEHRFGDFREIFFGSLLVIVMIAFPEGLVGVGKVIKARTYGRIRPEQRTWLSDLVGLTPKGPQDTGAPDTQKIDTRTITRGSFAPEPEGDVVIDANDVRVQFGGVVAVDGVSLALHDNEILGLVGPNGSGKTTVLNALTGVVDATGEIEVRGTAVKLGRPGQMRGFGILRTYQAPQTYAHLSCIEDVLLSTTDRAFTGITPLVFARPAVNHHEKDRWAKAMAALDRVNLGAYAELPTTRLTYGQRRLLELARAIYGEPSALMLDEPSAGLNAAETDQLAVYLQQLKDDGISILLVDHKLDFITSLCDRVAVLELGHLVAVGAADTVFADQRVVDAYLGVDEEF